MSSYGNWYAQNMGAIHNHGRPASPRPFMHGGAMTGGGMQYPGGSSTSQPRPSPGRAQPRQPQSTGTPYGQPASPPNAFQGQSSYGGPPRTGGGMLAPGQQYNPSVHGAGAMPRSQNQPASPRPFMHGGAMTGGGMPIPGASQNQPWRPPARGMRGGRGPGGFSGWMQ